MTRTIWSLALAAACTGGTKPTGGAGDTTDTTPIVTEPTTITAVPPPSGDPATVALAGPCAMPDRFGTFQVEVLDYYSQALGSAADGVLPITQLTPVGTAGDCELLRRNNPFCDPACDPGTVCDVGNVCVAEPVNQDLGTVTIGGLEQDLILQPVPPGNTYFATMLPHPVFLPDTLIELQTHGTTYGADVTLHGVGTDPITVAPADRDLVMIRDAPMPLVWNPPASSLGRSTVRVELSVDQHGLTPVSLVCDVPDTGSAEIDASLVTQLMDLGVTGFPSATYTRHTVDSAPLGDGCVELEIDSQVIPTLAVQGYIPCDDQGDCPTGTTCDLLVGLCG
jgi:hypothetical protein